MVADIAGVKLEDARVELVGELRNARRVKGPGRDDDIAGFQPELAGDHDEPVFLLQDRVDFHARTDGKVEGRRVGFEIVGQFILGGVNVLRRRKGHSGKRIVWGRREKPKRIPTLTPGVADPFARVEDHERQTSPRELVTGGQTRLPTTDDDRVVPT